jgi:hypothetical protein
MHRFVERHFKTEEGRRHFMTWLFRLADVDQTEQVTATGLHSVIQAIHRDGIHLDEFPHSDPQNCVSDILQHFDVSNRGYLDRDDFFLLADIIVQHYNKKSQEWNVWIKRERESGKRAEYLYLGGKVRDRTEAWSRGGGSGAFGCGHNHRTEESHQNHSAGRLQRLIASGH